jgi:hypothetical protein
LHKLFNRLVFKSYGCTYFNSIISRENCREIFPHTLEGLDIKSKREIGKVRAYQHNKLLKYGQTRYELKNLLGDFITYLNRNEIELIIVNFPATQHYLEFFNEDFIKGYYETIDELKGYGEFRFLDVALKEVYEESDFVDIDHMSDQGALKTTILIKNLTEGKSMVTIK